MKMVMMPEGRHRSEANAAVLDVSRSARRESRTLTVGQLQRMRIKLSMVSALTLRFAATLWVA